MQHIFIVYDFLSENVVRYSFIHFKGKLTIYYSEDVRVTYVHQI